MLFELIRVLLAEFVEFQNLYVSTSIMEIVIFASKINSVFSQLHL